MTAPSPRWNDARIESLRVKRGASPKVFNLNDGLHLRVYPSGVKSFGYMARNAAGNPQFRPFAQHAPVSDPAADRLCVADARLKLLDVKREAAVAATESPAAVIGVPAAGHTFRTAAAEWFVTKVDRMQIADNTKHAYRQVITDHFLDRAIPGSTAKGKPQLWGELLVADFTRKHEQLYESTLMTVEEETNLSGSRRGKTKPSTLANKTDIKCRKFFLYLTKCEYLSPDILPDRLENAHRGTAETRALTVAELERAFAETSVDAVRANTKVDRKKSKHKLSINEFDAVGVRLLLLTGGRLNSIRNMRRSNKNAHERGFWTLPHKDMKQTSAQKLQPRDHLIPMTAIFEAEVARLDRVSGEFDYLFIPRDARSRRAKGLDEKPVSESWAKHLTPNLAARFGNGGENPYSAHALRRTMSNFLLEMGFSPKVVDRCHARTDKSTDATYFAGAPIRDQVFNAFEQWAMFCLACMHGKGDAYLADLRGERTAEQRAIEAARMKRIGVPVTPHAA